MKLIRTVMEKVRTRENILHNICRDYDPERERCRREAERKCECAKQFLCDPHGIRILIR